ncbi:MAG: DNA pilot protein [Microviridae sp.]|nr:MAG: DNA pilot protein [Microviridae sp.]
MLDTKVSDATLGQSMAVGGLNAGIGAVTGLAGQWVNSIFNQAQSQREYERQKEFAQNSIQWRVADAQRAGIHPLAALGGQGINYSPVVDTESDYGGAIERSGQAFQSAMDRYLQNQMFQKSKADINLVEAQTAYYNALAQKTAQPEIASQKPQVSATPAKIGFDKNKAISVDNFDKDSYARLLQNGIVSLPSVNIGGKDGAVTTQNQDGSLSLIAGQADSDSADTNIIEKIRSYKRSQEYLTDDFSAQIGYKLSQELKVPVRVYKDGSKYYPMLLKRDSKGNIVEVPLMLNQ